MPCALVSACDLGLVVFLDEKPAILIYEVFHKFGNIRLEEGLIFTHRLHHQSQTYIPSSLPTNHHLHWQKQNVKQPLASTFMTSLFNLPVSKLPGLPNIYGTVLPFFVGVLYFIINSFIKYICSTKIPFCTGQGGKLLRFLPEKCWLLGNLTISW